MIQQLYRKCAMLAEWWELLIGNSASVSTAKGTCERIQALEAFFAKQVP